MTLEIKYTFKDLTHKPAVVSRQPNEKTYKDHYKTMKQTKHKQNLKKWAVFTYHSPRIRNLTNFFKHTGTGIAFRSTNRTQELTKPKQKKNTHKNTTKVESTNSLATYVN
jgi:hypothetical protein